MNRRCLNCMEIFDIVPGYESENNCCPFCGFVENTPPKYTNYLPPGTMLIDRYTLGTVIGAGGFGITYRAWDNTLNTQVAIKEYYPQGIVSRNAQTEVAGNSQTDVTIYNKQENSFEHGKQRFLKEAQSLAQLNSHPRTVSIHDFFQANNTAYIVMEFLKGCNLNEYIKNNSLPFSTIRKAAEQVCDALAAVHSIGLIHRDISPDNIYMCEDGSFKLIDFGAVKQSVNDTNLSATVVLKHGYAPIEQYSKSGNIGPWTDIYALSATLYRLTTGKLPQESIDRLSSDMITYPKSLNPSIPTPFANAIMKGMAIQVHDRYQNIEAFRRALFSVDEDAMTVSGNVAVGGISRGNIQGSFSGGSSGGINRNSAPVSVEEKKGGFRQFINGPAGIILIPLIAIIIMGAVIVYFVYIAGGEDSDDGGSEVAAVDPIDDEGDTEATTEAVTEAATEATTQSADRYYEISDIKVNTDIDDWDTDNASLNSGVLNVHFYWKLEKAPGQIVYKVKGEYPNGDSYEQVLEQPRNKGSLQGFTLKMSDENGNRIGMPAGTATVRVYNNETDQFLGARTVELY